MENRQPSKKLTRIAAGILTVAFLGFVCIALVASVATGHEDLRHSMQMTPEMRATLPEHANRLDRLAARINGFTSGISDIMWQKENLGYVNSAFQYALGKKLINTGSQNMLTLTTGHLYDIAPYVSLKEGAEGIADQAETTLKGLPFLFVYEHPTLYDSAMMPEEYAALDHSGQMADEAIEALRDRGIRVLDSRDVLPASGHDLNDLLMVTDQHWSTLAAITMAQAIAAELNDMTGAGLDPALLDLDQMNTLVHEKLFMGKYGQRVGTAFVTPDDIVEYWPKYDTTIHRRTLRVTTEEDVTDSFREAVTRFDRLDPDPGRSWNKVAYTYYGQVEAYSIFENADAPDCTLLLLKDSYSAPIGTFLSLLARNVVCVDLRRNVDSLESWVEKTQPDAVVMAYSLQMLRDDNYDFGG